MSAATEFAPVVYIPPRARPGAHSGAAVIALRPPSAESVAVPLRLTRRGVLALSALLAVVALALVWAAWLSAPDAAAGRSQVPATVTVHRGDTLWSIATRIAPGRDPRAVVDQLQRRNHLRGVELMAGQVLSTG